MTTETHQNELEKKLSSLTNIRAYANQARPISAFSGKPVLKSDMVKNLELPNLTTQPENKITSDNINKIIAPFSQEVPKVIQDIPATTPIEEEKVWETKISISDTNENNQSENIKKVPSINDQLASIQPFLLFASPLANIYPNNKREKKENIQNSSTNNNIVTPLKTEISVPNEREGMNSTVNLNEIKETVIKADYVRDRRKLIKNFRLKAKKNRFKKIATEKISDVKKCVTLLIPAHSGALSQRFINHLKNGRSEYANRLFQRYVKQKARLWAKYLHIETDITPMKAHLETLGKTAEKAKSVGMIFSPKNRLS
jgi:hypothetical protein